MAERPLLPEYSSKRAKRQTHAAAGDGADKFTAAALVHNLVLVR
jgi:hypothetical protein